METAQTPSIEDVIVSMLTENTGRHMLDSGGAYGRHWERNQGKSFGDEPVVRMDPHIGPEISVFHYLTDGRLSVDDIDPELAEAWYWHQVTPDMEPDQYWGFDRPGEYPKGAQLSSAEEFAERVAENQYYASGRNVHTFNSYNGETWLSQILQGVCFVYDGENYVLLQIHGGCDVRGGYTDAVLFRVHGDYGDPWGDLMGDDGRFYIFCENEECKGHPEHGRVVWRMQGGDMEAWCPETGEELGYQSIWTTAEESKNFPHDEWLCPYCDQQVKAEFDNCC